ncbi:MAG TPA: lipase maturation factor family protein [Gemmataceae bacterium]|nr:lipase maturation factor family protein [Gemmataceae bacterium]
MMSQLSAWFRKGFPSESSGARAEFLLSRWLFLRLLGVVYLAAFLSLGVQVRGLIGSQGILPVTDYLTAVRQATATERYYLLPTLCWLDASDASLIGQCIAGVVLSAALISGIAPVPVLVLLWALYLSLTVVGQEFLGYQWDALLLETGFLAILLAPWQWWPRRPSRRAPSRVILWLFRWLVFRLMFGSGVVKLLSGDQSWRSLRALQCHYETQPLPNWSSWYMHQLPDWFQQLSVMFTFGAELLVPILIFGPRRARLLACGGIVALQLLIAATGNYGFFNLLTIALCVLLLDDAVYPARWQTWFASPEELRDSSQVRNWGGWLTYPVAAGIFLMSTVGFVQNCGLPAHWPAWLGQVHRTVAAFRSVNSYGLFAIMTTRRPEIVIEGSEDGESWKPFEFRWKPGDPSRRPRFAGLHMPRLDWQLWFAALGSCQENRWFVPFMARLLQGSPEVQALLEPSPFPDRPPRYIRAILYQYHFTDPATRRAEGTWWRREQIGLYCPVLSLQRSGTDAR